MDLLGTLTGRCGHTLLLLVTLIPEGKIIKPIFSIAHLNDLEKFSLNSILIAMIYNLVVSFSL